MTVPKKIIHVCSKESDIEQIKKELARHVEVYRKESDKINEELDVATKCISNVSPKIESMWHTLEGNGQKGFKYTVIELNANVAELTNKLEESREDRKSLHEAITGLINYRSALTATFDEQNKENIRIAAESAKRQTNRQWLIYIIIVLGLGLAGLYINLRKSQKENTTLKTEIRIDEEKTK